MVAPFASAPDGPTQTATGTSDRSMARTMSSTPASIAPDDFTWSTSNVDPRSLASLIESRTSDSFGVSK